MDTSRSHSGWRLRLSAGALAIATSTLAVSMTTSERDAVPEYGLLLAGASGAYLAFSQLVPRLRRATRERLSARGWAMIATALTAGALSGTVALGGSISVLAALPIALIACAVAADRAGPSVAPVLAVYVLAGLTAVITLTWRGDFLGGFSALLQSGLVMLVAVPLAASGWLLVTKGR